MLQKSLQNLGRQKQTEPRWLLYSWRWGGASAVGSEDEGNCAQVLVLASLSQPPWGVAQKHAPWHCHWCLRTLTPGGLTPAKGS